MQPILGDSQRFFPGLLVEATDNTLAAGTYGLTMYKTAAQYDDSIAVQP